MNIKKIFNKYIGNILRKKRVSEESTYSKNQINKKSETTENLIKTLEQMTNTELEPRDIRSIYHANFPDWYKSIIINDDKYTIRGELYYGIQAIYDALVNDSVERDKRQDTIRVFDSVVDVGKDYLTKFYTGKENIDQFRSQMELLGPGIEILFDTKYKTKSRSSNAEANEYQNFYINYIKSIIDGIIFMPDSIISTACGGNELSMVTATVMDANLGFVRYSKRRSDSKVMILPEHKVHIQEIVYGKKIACIEDWVDTGKSLSGVMKEMEQINPSNMVGISSGWNNHNSSGLIPLYEQNRWNVFTK